MAKEEDPKKPGDGNQPPSETILAEARDPDEAVFAEQAILHYINWVLEQVRPVVEEAIESFGSWVASQSDSKMFNNQGFFAELTRSFMEQMATMMGGADTPLAQNLLPVLADPLDEAQRQESKASFFITEMARSSRDAFWYLRDNAQSVLSNQWDQLRDLAYEGSTEFIPFLHQIGLPTAELSGLELTQAFIAEAERFRASVPKEQEEAQQEADVKEQPEEAKEQAQQDKELFAEEEASKKAV